MKQRKNILLLCLTTVLTDLISVFIFKTIQDLTAHFHKEVSSMEKNYEDQK